jgi:hypothetical protein
VIMETKGFEQLVLSAAKAASLLGFSHFLQAVSSPFFRGLLGTYRLFSAGISLEAVSSIDFVFR